MLRTLLVTVLLSTALSGCVSSASPGGTESLDEATAAVPVPEPKEYTGVSRITEVSVCPHEGGCMGSRFGMWEWDIEDSFPARGATGATITATWESLAPPLETLRVFVYEGNLGAYHVVAEAEGTSPLTIEMGEEGLTGHGTLKVGFTGDGPATVLWDQEVAWTAVLTS